ncbi:MAG: cytochrome c oxidase assembly protein [Acidimicrobiales bacterium]|nr:cytochrome c oxidase assembly protein [Acidimicrobiales bacterium]MCB9373462.1 cytochrome c oxidase assembly protein [Microthrixaceae bacterium]
MPWSAALALPPITAARVAGWWVLDPVPLALSALSGWAYLAGVRRLAARGRRWRPGRTASFAAGLATVVVATQSGLARYDTTLFSVHAAQHVLLGMVAPLLLVLGAPMTLAVQATHRPTQRFLVGLFRQPVVRFVTHPITAWFLFGTTMFGLYLTGVYELSLRNGVVHGWVHLHLLAVGCLFTEAVVGLDPGWGRTRAGRPLGYPVRLLLVLLLVPFHAVLGLALLSAGEPVAAAWYEGLGRTWGASPLADQRTGAALMWGLGDLVGVVLAVVVAYQWMRADEREARRLDAADDAARARAAPR